MPKTEKDIFVCDTSVVVDGRVVELVREGKVKGVVVIPNAVLAELEHQANAGKETGFAGLGVLQKLKEMQKEFEIEIQMRGSRPSPSQIEYAKRGEIDAEIRGMAALLGATLITGDTVQKEVALVEGVKTLYLHTHEVAKDLSFKKYFAEGTMSVHLRAGAIPMAKIGKPGAVKLVPCGEGKLTTDDVKKMATEIVEATERNKEYYFEIDRRGAAVIQMGRYRIVITKPPFSDGFEITLVRPVMSRKIEEYKMSEKLKERLSKQAEGVIVCGPPGSGKSTFAAALANYYSSLGKIVKTMESPRDLQVGDEITQYAPLEGKFELTNDIMLLVRPDYSIYDEMRKTDDFEVYADMRMAGIGLVGVLHANRTIDAVQRFINRIDLGVIPQVVDTIIMIRGGEVAQVYSMNFKVKVPTGMVEEDLARPVIEVKEFETGKLEYEIYKFGEETVVLPISEEMEKASARASEPIDEEAAAQRIEKALGRIVKHGYELEFRGRKAVIHVHKKDIPKIIGRGGENISRIEKEVGVKIDVKEI
ncbi:hypothetical protein AUJ17_05615 [Candidatus Micrarchaeota archaeon CG1_02_47_40]|nr:MAG: hypothetical protein AUJ17_05615 [Candidatus Micrarchaeota archaeon CG1_02_47_40]